MRLCFTSDLHGNPELYNQLGALLARERPDLLILGGDLLPDGEIDNPDATQGNYVRERFLPLIRSWRTAIPNMIVATIMGNHDWSCSERAIAGAHERGEIVFLSHEQPWKFNGICFLGYSRTPPSPYWVKDYERLDRASDPTPETGGVVWDHATRAIRQVQPVEHFRGRPTIADDLRHIAPPPSPWVLVAHGPPFGSKLDRLPHIAEPLGSHAIRDFIERTSPLCSLHGHFHESPDVTGAFMMRIGETYCINPGQHRNELAAVLFELPELAGTIRHTLRA